jgi:hypothetical protein
MKWIPGAPTELGRYDVVLKTGLHAPRRQRAGVFGEHRIGSRESVSAVEGLVYRTVLAFVCDRAASPTPANEIEQHYGPIPEPPKI